MNDETQHERSAERTRDLIERVGDRASSCREFLDTTAKAGGGALALPDLGAGAAAGHKSNHDDGSNKGSHKTNSDDMSEDMNDDGDVTNFDILNYALTLEHLEAAYYNEFLDEYSEKEVESSSVAKVFTKGNGRGAVYERITDVRDHEAAHVDTLTQTIKKLGGEPVEAGEYAFPYESIEEFATPSATIEAVGVSAYAGAAPLSRTTTSSRRH